MELNPLAALKRSPAVPPAPRPKRALPIEGDVVKAYVPEPGKTGPGKTAVPCVVVWANKSEGQWQLHLAAGRPAAKNDPKSHRTFTLETPEEQAHAGLRGRHSFDMRAVQTIPWTPQYASMDTLARPAGELTRAAFDRMSHAYGRGLVSNKLREEERQHNARHKRPAPSRQDRDEAR